MQVLTTALGRPRDAGRGCGDGRAPWRAPGRARCEIPPRATLISLKVDQRCVVSSRDRACQMRDGGVIASAPATRPLVACISYYDLILNLARTKGRGRGRGDPILRGPSRQPNGQTFYDCAAYNQAKTKTVAQTPHTKHLAHTRYQIPP
jgi:hypothetical protein